MGMGLNVGIIGVGHIAESVHLPAYKDHSDTVIVAVSDLDEIRRQQIATEYSTLRQYEDYSEMIKNENLDLVSICSPPSTHEDIFKLSAEEGCNIYCEKPLTLNYSSAAEMAEVAKESGIVTQVGYALRYTRNYQRVLQILDAGLLGAIDRVVTVYHSPPPPPRWYSNPSVSGGGVIADKFPHILDFYLGIRDDWSVVDSDFQHKKTSSVEDMVNVELQAGETTATITAGWTHQNMTRKTIIVGMNGAIEVNSEEMKGTVQGERLYFKRGQRPKIQLGSLLQKWFHPTEDFDRNRVDSFIKCCLCGEKSRAPVERGVHVTQLIDDIYGKGGNPR